MGGGEGGSSEPLWICRCFHTSKPDFGADKQQKHRPAYAYPQFDQHHYYSLSGKYSSQTSSMPTFNILASLCN